ncbi:murein biosynthesis integral membrane protein MurJ [Paenibacillus sp. LPE1-1-1.1]|uniref:murein biosynthesis integral membrane protein MurJ n=1 Tax=Paenibacillus sp. LPE1-1-1.1 TaxID=3135230 RepID=UPI003438A11C
MKKAMLILMLLTILTKVLGFTREIILSYFYGASGVSDAYLISLTIPGTIFEFIAIGIATSYIPIYTKIASQKNVESADRFTNNLLNFIFIICSIIILIVFLFTTPIVKMFASGFTKETLTLAVLFTRIGITSIYFSGLIFVFNGYLQMKKKFIIPAVMGIPVSLIIMLSIFLSTKYDIVIISIGSALAMGIQLLIIIPFVIKTGYRYSFIFDWKDEHIRNMIFLSIPVIIGVSINQINILVDRTIASQIAVGGISTISYASRLNDFIQGVFVMTFTTVMYPKISKMAVEGNIKEFKKSLSEAINGINILVIPASIGAMVFAQPVVNLLYGRGAFDSQAISMTSNALFFYSIGMIGIGLREILSRAFFSLRDTKTPMINAAIAVVMNIVLNFIFSRYLGIGGLALATSISAIFCSILLFWSLKKKIGPLATKGITSTFIKILCASLLMGVIAKLSYNTLINYTSSNLSLITSVCLGLVVYFVIVCYLKIENVDNLINALKRKLKYT